MKLPFLLVALSMGISGGIASAQPAPHEQTTEEKNKEQTDVAIRKAQDEAVNIMKLPAAERNAKIQVMQDAALRAQLTQAGFTEKELQEDILDFVFDQNQARTKVREAGAKLFKAMDKKAAPAPDFNLLLADYLSAVETAKTQREEATKMLDVTIGFSEKPNLKALLIMQGIIGDAGWYLGEVQIMGQMGFVSLFPYLTGENGAAPQKVEPVKAVQ